MSRILLLSFSLLLVTSSPAAEFTFSQAWQVLQENNDGLAASRANRDKAEFMQQSARSLYMPQIDLTGSYSRLDDDISLSPSQLFDSMPAGDDLQIILGNLGSAAGIPAGQLDRVFTSQIADQDVVSASLSAVWPIYAGGRISAAQDIALGQMKEAGYLLRIKQQVLFEQLAKIYFGVVLAKEVLNARTDAEAGLFKHLDHARKLEDQGQIAKVERMKAEASYDKSKVERHKALRNFEIAQMALNRLLQAADNTAPTSTLFINNNLPGLAETTAATLDNHPGLGVLKAKRIQAQGLIEVEKGEYLPEVFLFGNYRLYEEDTLAAELVPDWIVGVGVKMPLSSRSGRSGKLKAARSSLMQVDRLKAQAIQDLGLLVEKTWREALTALEEYQGLASSLVLADENIHMRVKAFAQGLSTSLEVIDAELFLVNVKTQRQAAAYQYVLSLARLLALSNQMATFPNYQIEGKS